MASAPASMRASAAAAVAMFPAMRDTFGYAALTLDTAFRMFWLCPWAESRTSASTWTSTRAEALSSTSEVAPMAAAQSKRPSLSLADRGYLTAFSMSLMVMRPLR